MTTRRGFLAVLLAVAAMPKEALAKAFRARGGYTWLPEEAPGRQSSMHGLTRTEHPIWESGGGMASIPEYGDNYIPRDWRNTVIDEWDAMPWYEPE